MSEEELEALFSTIRNNKKLQCGRPEEYPCVKCRNGENNDKCPVFRRCVLWRRWFRYEWESLRRMLGVQHDR
jgi:hypothetical protein